jgi:glutamate-ammonia-ligase adenylyltransferase
LSEAEYRTLQGGYDFLRLVESRLRIVHNRSLDQLPENAEDLAKLARRLGLESGERLLAELERHWKQIRELFLERMHRDRFTRG